ncbi:MAG: hypothetical protein JXR78_18885 [Victivallales bacterium]|nr:hypothetical protein [Victivallales bacterium]
MDFIPAGEIIGDAHQVRLVRIAQNPLLPDGEYKFIDSYCSDPNCDCRKTMIQVMHNKKLVSIINYGWETPAFYEKWLGNKEKDDPMPSMSGASIDINSPNLVDTEEMLALFNTLLNDIWIAKFKNHYKKFKAAIAQ